MSMNFRKLVPVVAAAALVLSGVVTGTSTAQAATIKQGVKCSPVNAKKTVGTVKYTCTTNPIGTPVGNTWTTSDCIAANGAYLEAKKQYDGFVASQTSTLAAIKASIDASTHSIEVLNQQIALTKTKEYIIGYNHTVKPTVAIKVVGIDAAIAAIQTHIADITTKRDNAGKQRDASAAILAAKYTATQIAGWAAAPVSALSNADVNVQNYANWIRAYSGYDGALSSAQKNIANLQKVPNNFTTKLTAAQAQVDSMTKRYNQAIANQPSQSATIKSASDQALSVRKSACKAGL
jgi:phage shock protein A